MELNTVLLEITDKCNLNCRHCMNRPDSQKKEINIEQMKKLFDSFSQYNAEKIYLSGGEPLIHSAILEIIELCGHYPKMKFVITTNGLLLTENIMKQIDERDNMTMQFSVDGVSTATFESIRGVNTFSCFREKMAIWREYSKKEGLGRTCLNKENFKELPQIYEYCLENRLYPSFIFVSRLGNGEINWNKLDLSLAEKIWCISTINKMNNHYKINSPPPEAPATCNFTENTGIVSLLIRADGRVAPCQYFYNDSLGNIFTDSIESILTNHWIKDHWEIAQKRKIHLENSPQCIACKIKAGCNYGCVGMANDMGDIMGYDGLCELRVMTTICYSNHIIPLNKYAEKKNTVHISKENDL